MADDSMILNKYFSSMKPRHEDMANGDTSVTVDDLIVDFNEDIEADPEFQLDLEHYQLEHMKLQLKFKEKILQKKAERQAMHAASSNRCVLPGGKIVVKNVTDSNFESRDADSSFTVGAGDSALPALQLPRCVVCGRRSEALCARCALTPYCSERCQRRDWRERHSAVCHNLARYGNVLDVTDAEFDTDGVPPTPALRRPRSPATVNKEPMETLKMLNQRTSQIDIGDQVGNHLNANNDGEKRFGNRRDDGNQRNFSNRDDGKQKNFGNRDSGNQKNFGNRDDGNQKNFGNRDDGNQKNFGNRDDGNQKNFGNRVDGNQRNSNQRDEGNQRNFAGNQKKTPLRNNNEPNEDSGSVMGPKPRIVAAGHNPSPSPRGTARNFQQKQGESSNNNRCNKPSRWNDRNQAEAAAKTEDENWGKTPTKPEPAPVTPVAVAPQPVKKVTTPQPKVIDQLQASEPQPKVVAKAEPKLVPEKFMVETLPLGAQFVVSVDALAKDCRGDEGFVCLTMCEEKQAEYESLCDEYGQACEADTKEYTPQIGTTFSYRDTDGGWYRARLVAKNAAALLDTGRVTSQTPASADSRALTGKYADVPEFYCVVEGDGVKLGDSLKCTIVSRGPNNTYTVSMIDMEGGGARGSGRVKRWLPKVEYPDVQQVNVAAEQSKKTLPTVPRPPVTHNTRYTLADVTALDKVFIVPVDVEKRKMFDVVLHDVVLYGVGATPLTTPPKPGQTVIARFSDGIHYRALVARTNVSKDKYLLEYLEFGNVDVAKLSDLFPCPSALDMKSHPVMTSLVTLGGDGALGPVAADRVEAMKDGGDEMILTLPSGQDSAPSGSEVTLTLKNGEVLNRLLVELSMPEWKKQAIAGIQDPPVMITDVQWSPLKPHGLVSVLDASALQEATLSVASMEARLPNTLASQIAEYCNSDVGSKKYLPRAEELCFVQRPPENEWVRAAVMEQEGGAGGDTLRVLLLDTGHTLTVPVGATRKMPPDLARPPAVAVGLEILDFPPNPTPAQLAMAREFMKLDSSGVGTLEVQDCMMHEQGWYMAKAPKLVQAVMGL